MCVCLLFSVLDLFYMLMIVFFDKLSVLRLMLDVSLVAFARATTTSAFSVRSSVWAMLSFFMLFLVLWRLVVLLMMILYLLSLRDIFRMFLVVFVCGEMMVALWSASALSIEFLFMLGEFMRVMCMFWWISFLCVGVFKYFCNVLWSVLMCLCIFFFIMLFVIFFFSSKFKVVS